MTTAKAVSRGYHLKPNGLRVLLSGLLINRKGEMKSVEKWTFWYLGFGLEVDLRLVIFGFNDLLCFWASMSSKEVEPRLRPRRDD